MQALYVAWGNQLQVNLSDINHELGKAKESLVFESGEIQGISNSALVLLKSFFLFSFTVMASLPSP